MRIPIAVLSALFIAFSGVRADEPARTNPALVGLAANSWMYVNPRPYQRKTPTARDENSPLKDETVTEPPFREYTSPIYGDGKIFYFGGGHSGYPGNDMEIYDPVANSWRQCYPPRCPPKGDTTYYSGGSQNCRVDPETGALQPYVIHGYARTQYDADRHLYVCTATFPTKTERDPETKRWKLAARGFGFIAFDARTNEWRWLGPAQDLGPLGLSEFDRDLGGILGFAGREVRVFKKDSWSPIATSPIELSRSGGAPVVYVPDRKQHVFALLGHGGKNEIGQLALFDVAEKKARVIDSVPDELRARLAPGTGGYNLAMAYDAANKRLVVMSVSDAFRPDVWLFDVAADRWTKVPAAATAPTLKSRFEPGMGRAPLMFDPVHGVFFLIFRKNASIETWAYRPPAVLR
jgi:hypothetical protein